MTQLHLDLNHRTPIEPVWSFGGSVGHASLLLRPDVRRQVQICRDELGLRHLRLVGLLSEEMAPSRADGSLDFTKVEAVIDALMEDGYLPFITLSASQSPAERWYESVRALATLIDGRYGCDAREWYFEVRPGSDDSVATGSDVTAEPLRRFDLAARAIKEIQHEFRVGLSLPAAAADAFLRHAALTTPTNDYWLDARRCDFATMDAPPGTAGVAELAAVRQRVTEALGPKIPLICTSWGSSPPGSAAVGLDPCAAAAATCQTAAEIALNVQGMIFDPLSDIRDPSARCAEPFHGGPGLLTVNDIRKASFNALRFFGDHRGYHCQSVGASWTDPIAGLGCVASVEEYTLRLLCWYHHEPGDAAPASGPARFTIEGLPPSVHMAQVEVIRPGAGSPYEAWVERGRPPFINRTILDALEQAAHPAMADVDFREYPPRLEPGMVMQLTIPLPFEEHWTD